MESQEADTIDISMSEVSKDEVPKKKRRALKRVIKKDKAKGFKPIKSVNNKSLNRSLNRSVTSYVIKQTLQSNNRQLAMTLEKTRQELRMANGIIMDQKREIGDLQFHVSTYKHLAGLRPEEIESEVQYRMEKYISELKTHLGKMGQQLLDATSSLGDAMDVCMSVSWRSGGSCRSSTASNMSDDEGNHGNPVRAAPKPPMLQEEVLQSDPTMRSLPQRVACLDMSVIAEQSILIDDMPLPADFNSAIDEALQEEEMVEDENGASFENQGDATKLKSQNKDTQCKKDKHLNTELESPVSKEVKKLKAKDDNSEKHASTKGSNSANKMKIESTDDGSKCSNKIKRRKSRKETQENKDSGETVDSETLSDQVEKGNKKDRRGTFVLKDSDFVPACNSTKDKKKKDTSNRTEKDRTGIDEIHINDTEDVQKMDRKQESEKTKRADFTRSKGRRETYVLPHDTGQKEILDKNEKERHETEKVEKNAKERRETFLVQKDSLPVSSQKDSLQSSSLKDSLPVLSQKDRRETFVLPAETQPVVSSKSEEKLNLDKPSKNLLTSKSDTVLDSKDDKRKTFLIPAGKDDLQMPPPSVDLKKITEVESSLDPEVTEYFNCDMDFTEVIDNSNRIIIEPETDSDKTSKVNRKDKVQKNASGNVKNKSSNDVKKDKTDKNTSVPRKDKCYKEDDIKGKGQTSEKMSDAVEFRLPKPGKIVFAASRKAFDGSREKVPTKLPQRSRSKSKVKLTKSTSEDSNINSMFDFHEKTPVFLRHGPTVYDLSMNESVHTQKESYGAFRDKVNKPVNKESKDLNEKQDTEKTEVNQQKEKEKPNEKGEIIYHVPLKECSPETPKVKSRSKSKGRERSQSRGRNKSNDLEQQSDEKASTTSRSRSRGRSRTRKNELSEDKDEEKVNEETYSKKKPRKSRIISEENDDSETEVVTSRRGRSKSRSCRQDRQEVPKEEEDVSNTRRSKSRSRSTAKISYKEVDSENEIDEEEKDSENDKKGRRRSRGRSKTRKTDSKIKDDTLESGFMPVRSITRSKSRGRSKSHTAVIDDSDPKQNALVSKDNLETDTYLEDCGIILKSSKSKSKSRPCVQSLDDGKDDEMKVKRSRSKPARSLPAEKSDLSDDEDFKAPSKSAKKSRAKSGSKVKDNNIDPLDRLFKNARKKSFSEIDFSISDILSVTDDNICSTNQDKNSSVEICETPVKKRDIIDKQTTETLISESPLKDNLCNRNELPVNMKCVTKRGRSRSKKVNRMEELDDCTLTESVNTPFKMNEGEESGDLDVAISLAKNLEVLKSGSKDGQRKRRLDSASSDANTDKKKRSKTENKENDVKKSTSSLSMLKRKLQSLGGSKAELPKQTPVKEYDSGVSPLRPSMERENISSPVMGKHRPSKGSDLLTPKVDSENEPEAPRSRRRAGNVCYKEISLNAKLRREDVLQGKKLLE